MEKRTLYALVAVLVVGAIAVAVHHAPEKGQRQGPPPRPIAEIKADEIAELQVTNEKQEQTTLHKTSATEWRVTKPGDWKADPAAVKQLVDGVTKLTFADTVSETADKHAELGVADGKSARLTVKDSNGKTVADLLVGKTVGGYTMVRLPGKNEVWQASGLMPFQLSRDPKGWRDHTIFDLVASDVEKLSVEAPGQKITLEKSAPAVEKGKPDEGGGWKIVESSGPAPKAGEPFDSGLATSVSQQLATLKAADFADDKKKDDVVGKGDGVSLTLTVKGKAHTLWVGAAKGDDFDVVSSDSPQVYVMKRFNVEHIARKPIDYRDKSLAKVKADDLTSVEITSGGETTVLNNSGGKWSAAKGTVDDKKIKPVVSGFEHLQADAVSEERDPAKTGLKKPLGEAVLHTKDKQTITIKVGALVKEDYFVAKDGNPDVFKAKRYMIERWLKKPADLLKK